MTDFTPEEREMIARAARDSGVSYEEAERAATLGANAAEAVDTLLSLHALGLLTAVEEVALIQLLIDSDAIFPLGEPYASAADAFITAGACTPHPDPVRRDELRAKFPELGAGS